MIRSLSGGMRLSCFEKPAFADEIELRAQRRREVRSRKRRSLLRQRMEPLVAHLDVAATRSAATSKPGIWIGPISLFSDRRSRSSERHPLPPLTCRRSRLPVAEVDERARRVRQEVVVRDAVRDALVPDVGVVPAVAIVRELAAHVLRRVAGRVAPVRVHVRVVVAVVDGARPRRRTSNAMRRRGPSWS